VRERSYISIISWLFYVFVSHVYFVCFNASVIVNYALLLKACSKTCVSWQESCWEWLHEAKVWRR